MADTTLYRFNQEGSIVPKRTRKPSKKQQERQDARPFAHASGRWAKKCRGRFVYLGSVLEDPTGEKAWLKWLDIRDDVRAGRKPRPKTPEGLTVRDLVNRWLTSKQRKLDSGELTTKTFKNYRQITDIMVPCLGPDRLADDLTYEDFAKLRSVLSKRFGPSRLRVAIVIVRGVFKFGLTNGLLKTPAQFGTEFDVPSAKMMRLARNGQGPRMFEPQQIRALIEKADPTEKAIVLLAINGAMGAKDIAEVPMEAVDLESGWLRFARSKTGIDRKIPLWSETVEAIRDMLAVRRKAKPGCKRYLLLTKNGRSWLTAGDGRQVSAKFGRLAKRAGVEGRQMYDLRRTFQTIGEESRDLAAVQAIMGHAARSDDMSAIYRQRVSDDRLRVVVGVVHDWLFSAGTSNEAG